jgi:hypothetical protein
LIGCQNKTTISFSDAINNAFDNVSDDMVKYFTPNYLGFGRPFTREYIQHNTPPHIQLALNYVTKILKHFVLFCAYSLIGLSKFEIKMFYLPYAS